MSEIKEDFIDETYVYKVKPAVVKAIKISSIDDIGINPCKSCYFFTYRPCDNYACQAGERPDKQDVIFVEVD